MYTARTLLLILASISYIIVVGGATYEHLSVVPQWSAAPPASLTMYQGEYALHSISFWPPMHVLTIVLLLTAAGFNWNAAPRPYVLIALAGYGLVIGITAVYFLPELSAITQTPYQPTVDPVLTARAATWEKLSLVRLGFMLLVAATLLFGLTKVNEPFAAKP